MNHQSRTMILCIAAEELSTKEERLKPEMAEISDSGFSALGSDVLVMDLKLVVPRSRERSVDLRERVNAIVKRIVEEVEFPDGVAKSIRERRLMLTVEVELRSETGCCSDRHRATSYMFDSN